MLSLPLGHELVIIKREFENDLIPNVHFSEISSLMWSY